MTDFLNFRADLTDPEVADCYEDSPFWSSLFGQLLLQHLRLAPRLVALDVGCGTGFPLLELADRLGPASVVHGIDAWEPAVARARRKARVRGNANVHVAHGDAAHMPYESASFDLIVSNLGVNNFDAPDAVMAECHRVCKPQARLALTTNLVGHMSEFYALYEQVLSEMGKSSAVGLLREHVAHRATPARLRELFAAAGFEVTCLHRETFTLHYADGSAFLRAYLSKLGFLDGWRKVLPDPEQEIAVFEQLEKRLNVLANERGGLSLSIPAAYVEGRKSH